MHPGFRLPGKLGEPPGRMARRGALLIGSGGHATAAAQDGPKPEPAQKGGERGRGRSGRAGVRRA